MLRIFKNEKKFSILFFIVLAIDIIVKVSCPVIPYRYISKPPVLMLLLAFFIINKSRKNRRKNNWVIMGLICFFIGDILIINHLNIIFLGISLFLFSLGKIFFTLKFSHKADFEVVKLVPFSIIMFVYTVFIISILYNDLGDFFVPALLSFFLSLLLFQFAFLRKKIFNNTSYYYVFIGVILYILSESIMAIKTFKTVIPFQDVLIMLFYGMSLYLLVLGILREKPKSEYVNV